MAVSDKTALAVKKRGDDVCAYCTRAAPLSIDHVTPRVWFDDPLSVAQGDSDAPSNLVGACGYCNSLKRDMNLTTFAVYLRERYDRDTTTMVARVNTQLTLPLPS